MAKKKNCIICPRRNGSHEHTFPATLGGRRTNTGIYCGLHNQKFGHLAGILSAQLNAINAWLGVRPDHSDRPTRLVTDNPVDRESYIVSGQKIELAKPRVLNDTEMPDGTHQIAAIFSSEQQLQEWLAEQRMAGNEVKIAGPRTTGYGVFTEPYALRLTLGGPEGLRAVGYVALTFLAHHFPSIARQRDLKLFKDFICGAANDEPVWWDFDNVSADLPRQCFRFGHRVVVGVSASCQEAYARVSFFSTLNFAVRFGAAKVDKDQTVIVDIDPLADRAPLDIHVTKIEKLLAPVARPVSVTEGHQADIQQGKAEERFRLLLGNIFSWLLDQAAEELLPHINAARSLNAPMRQQRVREVLTGQEQRVFNLISFAVTRVKAGLMADTATAAVAPSLDLLIASDPNSPTAITQAASFALELGMGALTAHICRQLDGDEMNLSQLSTLLGHGPGAFIVGRAVIQPWATQLGLSF
jgi:hypothetical protein